MDIENHIWNLVTKKLANEATEEDLDELNELLRQNPDIHDTIKPVLKWWYDDQGHETDYNNNALFEKILERIKEGDEALKYNKDLPVNSLKKSGKATRLLTL
jgi:putative ABC transport system permease protein